MTDDRGRSGEGIVIERVYKAAVEELWALWTTKDGFESWWGPRGFRSDVRRIEARRAGALVYDMVAETPAMVAAMRSMGKPVSTECKGHFSEFKLHERLVLTQVIDFFPGVQPYDSTIEVDFVPIADGQVRMVVTLHPMHDPRTSKMQHDGFTSQLTKLDERFGWHG